MDESKHNIVRLYKEKLNVLLDVAQTINEDNSIEALMSEFETLIREELGVSKCLIFTLSHGKWQNILACGVSGHQKRAIDVERDLCSITSIRNITMDRMENLDGFDAVIPLYHKFKIIGYVVVGDDDNEDGISPTIRNLKFIQILANLIIVFIENKKMQQELLRQESIKRELELASRIQAGLVPSDNELLKTSHTDVRSIYYPHAEVGGDYYDVIRLSPYSIGFCIADVSGKGIGASLLMSNFQAMVRALFTHRISLKKLVSELNKRVSQNTKNDKFITMFLARYNMVTGRLSYVNAGHLPPIVYNRERDQMIELERGCIGIGMLEEIPGLEVGHIRIHKGTRIIAFTDGLVEIDEGTRIRSSVERLKYFLRSTDNIADTMDKIKTMVHHYRDEGFIFDDVSVLGLEFVKKSLLTLPW
ncbi:MAG: SpoIIE family protein phosphatase [Bacteroidales bacterium]|nr:SpoIIE family protein phosphatase [Bacteroidales bacterium]